MSRQSRRSLRDAYVGHTRYEESATARVVHFEIQADDVGRAKAFYAQVISWQFRRALAALPRSGERKRIYCVEMGRISPFRCT